MVTSGLIFLFFSAFFGGNFAEETTHIISTKQGKVEGSLSSNGLYYEFLALRYGVVPEKFCVSYLPA